MASIRKCPKCPKRFRKRSAFLRHHRIAHEGAKCWSLKE